MNEGDTNVGDSVCIASKNIDNKGKMYKYCDSHGAYHDIDTRVRIAIYDAIVMRYIPFLRSPFPFYCIIIT